MPNFWELDNYFRHSYVQTSPKRAYHLCNIILHSCIIYRRRCLGRLKCGIYFLNNHHRLSLCCTCSAHVSWLLYVIHDCGCCDVQGWTSIKFFMWYFCHFLMFYQCQIYSVDSTLKVKFDLTVEVTAILNLLPYLPKEKISWLQILKGLSIFLWPAK